MPRNVPSIGTRTFRRWLASPSQSEKPKAIQYSYPQKVGAAWQRLHQPGDEHPSWVKRAERVKEGKEKSVLQVLEERGLVNQLAGYG